MMMMIMMMLMMMGVFSKTQTFNIDLQYIEGSCLYQTFLQLRLHIRTM